MLLQAQNISYTYAGNHYQSISEIDFSITRGEILALVGESGCGKSTLLKCLYGILTPDTGTVYFENEIIKGTDKQLVPGHEALKYLDQQLDLVNYASVFDNVGTYISNIDIDFKQKRIESILESVGMLDFKNDIPRNLSGGQRQRVALARAIAKTPKLLLLDEPFANIDNILKLDLRDKLFELFKTLNITIIFSTHAIEDALGFADKLFIMKAGKRIQYATPREIYENPQSAYVAALFGYVNQSTSAEIKQFFNLDFPQEKQFYYPHELPYAKLQIAHHKIRYIFMGSYTIQKVQINQKNWYLAC